MGVRGHNENSKRLIMSIVFAFFVFMTFYPVWGLKY